MDDKPEDDKKVITGVVVGFGATVIFVVIILAASFFI